VGGGGEAGRGRGGGGPPADLPKVRTSVSAKLTKPKSLCANI